MSRLARRALADRAPLITGDGSTDDTARIQAAIDSAIAMRGGYRAGDEVQLPPGDYRITAPLVIHNVCGLTFRGSGKEATRLIWDGPYTAGAFTPMILLSSAQSCVVERMQLAVAAGKRASVGINMITASGSQFVSAENRVADVKVSVDGRMDEFVVIGGTHAGAGLDANNDFHTIERCRVIGYRRHAIRVDNTQAFDIRVRDVVGFGQQFTTTATISSGSAVATVPSGKLNTDDVGTMVEISGAGANASILRASIAAVGATTITLSTSASSTVTGATLRYGAQSVGYMRRGNYLWSGGGGNGNLDADWILGTTGGAPAEIADVNCESSRRFVRGVGPTTTTRPVSVRNFRWSGDGVIAEDRNVLSLAFPGDFDFANGSVGDRGTDHDCRVLWGWGPLEPNRGNLTFRNVVFAAETAANGAAIFTGTQPTSLQSCIWSTSTTNTRL